MNSNEPSPRLAAKEIVRRFERSDSDLSVYWIAIRSDRSAFARNLSGNLSDWPMAVSILKKPSLFEHPNSIMSDLAALLDDVRDELSRCFSTHKAADRWGIVLISRVPFAIGQSSSPAVLPEWFPDKLAGNEIHCSIEDVTWRTLAALDEPDLMLNELHRRLYTLESALLRRLRAVSAMEPGVANGLFSKIYRNAERSGEDLLSQAEKEWQSVNNPSSYRPSSRSHSLVARIWSKVMFENGAYVAGLADDLACALHVDTELLATMPLRDSFFASLRQTNSNSVRSLERRFGLNLAVTIATSMRLLTMAHHADAYGSYPYSLLYSTSSELRVSLSEYEQFLNLHEV